MLKYNHAIIDVMYTKSGIAVRRLGIDKLNLAPPFLGVGAGSEIFKGVCRLPSLE